MVHRALQIQEVFVNILDELGASSDPPHRDPASLASLALVCRAFLEPSLDGLWKRQRDLLPLLKAFPANKWTVDGGSFVRILSG